MIFGLEFGCRGPLLVRHEHVGFHESADDTLPWRVLYASDLHLTARRAHLGERLAATAAEHSPDVVLLGGDLLDRQGGLAVLRALVGEITRRIPVVAVAGNHDAIFGLAAVRDAVLGAGGAWLPDGAVVLESAGRPPLHLDAHARPSPSGAGHRRILVAHRPDVADAAADRSYDLVLAGHLHGGQCVLWNRGPMLYPGAWFSRWNGLRFQLGETTMLVSRGAADTLPVRFRCPREVVLVALH